MPTEGDCRQRAEADRQLADALVVVGNFNWAITALFYAAMHQVNRLKVRDGCYSDGGSHMQTETYLNRHPAALTAYVALMGKSRRTRYEVGYLADNESYVRALRHLERLVDYVDRVTAGLVPGR